MRINIIIIVSRVRVSKPVARKCYRSLMFLCSNISLHKQNKIMGRSKNQTSMLYVSTALLTYATALTCMRFMASRIWSRWCAELRASRRMSVNFSSFSLSSLFSCRIISASASVHSHILKRRRKIGRRLKETSLLQAVSLLHIKEQKMAAAGKT